MTYGPGGWDKLHWWTAPTYARPEERHTLEYWRRLRPTPLEAFSDALSIAAAKALADLGDKLCTILTAALPAPGTSTPPPTNEDTTGQNSNA